MKRSFALVANDRLDPFFINRITKALDRYGKTSLVQESDLPAVLPRFDLLMIDANDVLDAAGLVGELRQGGIKLPIVVFLLEHDLTTARAVLKMGANDCLVKGLDEESFLVRLKSEFLKPVPF